jgi:putative DNA primase/helicase
MFPCRNAIVHLPSLIARKPKSWTDPTPLLLTTWAAPFDFDPRAPTPRRWLEFLDDQWGSDPESIECLQEWFAYCLTSDTSQQKILALIGPKRAGKDTIGRVLRDLVGPENTAGPTMASLATNFGLAPLLGKHLAIIGDARLSGRTDTAAVVERLLTISGEGTLTVDRKHREDWTGKLPTRFVLISNELPKLIDASGAMVSRLILLQMTRSFYGAEDRGLYAALRAELPGIFLWALEGRQRLAARGRFAQSESGQKLLDELLDLTSPVGAFVHEHIEVDPEETAPVEEVFGRWKGYCVENGLNPGSSATLGRNLRAVIPTLGTGQTRQGPGGKVVRVFRGIALRAADPFGSEAGTLAAVEAF